MSDDTPFPWNGKYTARVCHLRPGHLVGVSCECGHSTELSSDLFRSRYPAREMLRDLTRKLRCVECGATWKGRDLSGRSDRPRPVAGVRLSVTGLMVGGRLGLQPRALAYRGEATVGA